MIEPLLINAVRQIAIESSCLRIRLVTTDDILAALHFYHKRGFHPVAICPDALRNPRQLNPKIRE